MRPRLVVLFGVLISVCAITYAVSRRAGGRPAAATAADPGHGAGPRPAVVDVTLQHSTDQTEWLQAAVAAFQRAEPTIRVTLIGKGSIASASAILDGVDRPVLWSPADSLVVNVLAADWQTKHQAPLFPTTGDRAPQPLVLSPLVFAVWEERARVLLGDADASAALTWRAIRKAVMSTTGWGGIGGKPAWGFVTLGHTDPTKANSGLQALVLMAYEYFHVTSGLTVEQMLDPKFQDFVKDIERGVSHFESTSDIFMTDMVRFGPSRYDIAVVYESLAVSQLDNAQGRWGSLHIYYPPVTIWNDHPIIVFDAPWVSPDQARAATRLITFLRSAPIQATALRYGFRPANTSVPMTSPDPTSPFARAMRYGLSLELPSAVQPPDAAVIRNLMMMWSRLVKPE